MRMQTQAEIPSFRFGHQIQLPCRPGYLTQLLLVRRRQFRRRRLRQRPLASHPKALRRLPHRQRPRSLASLPQTQRRRLLPHPGHNRVLAVERLPAQRPPRALVPPNPSRLARPSYAQHSKLSGGQVRPPTFRSAAVLASRLAPRLIVLLAGPTFIDSAPASANAKTRTHMLNPPFRRPWSPITRQPRLRAEHR